MVSSLSLSGSSCEAQAQGRGGVRSHAHRWVRCRLLLTWRGEHGFPYRSHHLTCATALSLTLFVFLPPSSSDLASSRDVVWAAQGSFDQLYVVRVSSSPFPDRSIIWRAPAALEILKSYRNYPYIVINWMLVQSFTLGWSHSNPFIK